MDEYTDESIDTATGTCAPAELSTKRVHDIFSNIARKYELFNAVSSLGAYRLWVNKLVSLANVSPASAIIDIAGGTGEISFAIAKKKAPAAIVCTDLVQEMLDVAKEHYDNGASKGVPVHFRTTDAQEMPFDDDTFDIATMAYGLRNMPERKKALSETLRILRPGGQLVCLDFSTPRHAPFRYAYELYRDKMVPLWGKLVTGDSSEFVYLADSIKAFPDQEGVAELMEDAGFQDIEWHNCTDGIACIHVAYKPGTGAQLSKDGYTTDATSTQKPAHIYGTRE